MFRIFALLLFLIASPFAMADTECKELYVEIEDESSCQQQELLFKENFKECSSSDELRENGQDFRDFFFDIGDCYRDAKDEKKAREIYEAGLKESDWEIVGPVGEKGHDILKSSLDSLKRINSQKCFKDYAAFETAVTKFVKSKDASDLKSYAAVAFEECTGNHCSPANFSQFESKILSAAKKSKLAIKTVKPGDPSLKFKCIEIEGWKNLARKSFGFCSQKDAACVQWTAYTYADK